MPDTLFSVIFIAQEPSVPDRQPLSDQGIPAERLQRLCAAPFQLNTALEQAEGAYITFIREDDRLGENALATAQAFLEAHPETDVLALRIREASGKPHIVDYKFNKGERVIDLADNNELFCVQTTLVATVIRHDAISKLRFNESLRYGAERLFINSVLLQRLTLGVTNKAEYHTATDSRVIPDNRLSDPAYYLPELEGFHQALFALSEAQHGTVVPFVQSCVGFDLLWRFGNDGVKKALSEQEQQTYTALAHRLCTKIDDRVLFRHPRHTAAYQKADAARYKYEEDFFQAATINNHVLQYRGFALAKLLQENDSMAIVVRAEIENETLVCELLLTKWIYRCADSVIMAAGDREMQPQVLSYGVSKVMTPDGEQDYYALLHYELPLKEALPRGGANLTYRFYMVKNGKRNAFYINFGKFVVPHRRNPKAYQLRGKYALRWLEDDALRVYHLKRPKAAQQRWDEEARQYLLENGRDDIADLRYNRLPAFRKKNRFHGKIWLVSDRIDNAGDNGEVLFTYLCQHKPRGVRPVFVIGEKAKEEVKARLRGIGEVLMAEDKDYPLYFLSAEKIISSSAGEFTINPFGKDMVYYRDLCTFRYYFMNHGVNCGDCSKWLNKYNKNIHIFFTTGRSERQNILDRHYNLSAEQVVITGLARFDALYEDTKKQLLILPSWRRAYRECYDEKTSSVYFDGFRQTPYYRFYNGLMQDERLLRVMREKGYTGIFCLHPIFKEQARDFEANDVFRVNEGFVDYNKVFAESSVMVTDYSTIAFDFAYLNKPIVYTQFDKEDFYRNQIYDECFDYAKEGFGPVCETLDSAVDALVALIENDCQNEYLDRVNAFFVYHDKQNAARIVNTILNEKE